MLYLLFYNFYPFFRGLYSVRPSLSVIFVCKNSINIVNAASVVPSFESVNSQLCLLILITSLCHHRSGIEKRPDAYAAGLFNLTPFLLLKIENIDHY